MGLKENEKFNFEIFAVDNGFILSLPERRKHYIAYSEQTVLDIIKELLTNPPQLYQEGNANQV